MLQGTVISIGAGKTSSRNRSPLERLIRGDGKWQPFNYLSRERPDKSDWFSGRWKTSKEARKEINIRATDLANASLARLGETKPNETERNEMRANGRCPIEAAYAGECSGCARGRREIPTPRRLISSHLGISRSRRGAARYGGREYHDLARSLEITAA